MAKRKMPKTTRPSKDMYYLNIAKEVATRGTCLRRLVGAIIVKNGKIISTGYVGAPKDEPNCIDVKKCKRKELNIPSGKFYELCVSVHGEENAILNAASTGADIYGAVLYLFSDYRDKGAYPKGQHPTEIYLPCYRCKKLIINSGLEKVITLINGKIEEFGIGEIRKLKRQDEEKWSELTEFFKSFKK